MSNQLCRRSASVVALVFLAAGITGTQASENATRSLSLDGRIECQRALEEVKWAHRIWPDANPTPKPPLSSVLSDNELRTRVENGLLMSSALAEYYDTKITPARLQAEMNRMARQTRAPGKLKELFAALDNEPVLVAECLARPVLARRKLHDAFAWDDRIHGAQRQQLEARLAEAGGAVRLLEDQGATIIYSRAGNASSGNRNTNGGLREIPVSESEWSALIEELKPGREPNRRSARNEKRHSPISASGRQAPRLEETETAFHVRKVVEVSKNRIVTRSVTWPKQSFDDWWRETRRQVESRHNGYSGKQFNLPEISDAAGNRKKLQDGGSWTTYEQPPAARGGQSAVWTGSEMIVWGGYDGSYLNSGGRYRPATDSWINTSISGAPDGRSNHTAVWAGSEMIIWGGYDGSYLNTGGRYDPVSNTWTPTSTGNAPLARDDHTAVWTGSEMIVWGGYFGDYLDTGGRYDPSTDTWTDTSTTNAPSDRTWHTAVWTGSEMVVWGGDSAGGNLDTGGRYDPETDLWFAVTTMNAPSARRSHTAVWTGTEMVVWGGFGGGAGGGRYDPSTDSWSATSTSNAPGGRRDHTAVWTGHEMMVWGGYDGDELSDGGRYDLATDSWHEITDLNVPTARDGHSAVWTGSEMVIWGGGPTAGGRYDPETDAWQATATGPDTPSRTEHSTVWTGSELIVWGGCCSGNSGARFEPATNTWTPTSTVGAPTQRYFHTAVWTGSEMIVWGGFDNPDVLDTGGRYDPTSDTWTATSTTGAPSAREVHTAIWSGTEMIVWGGWDGSLTNTGGRYDPSDDSWTTVNTDFAPAERERHTAVWAGDEMIIWGGNPISDTGGRYDPAADAWSSTARSGAPDARRDHTAVWTGDRMIVWGGEDSGGSQATGGRYDPATNGWTGTDTSGAPSARRGHSAVWTGNEMIVWGGGDGTGSFRTGGRYDPVADAWTATTNEGAPGARSGHAAVWTGDSMIVDCCTSYGIFRLASIEKSDLSIVQSDSADPVAPGSTLTYSLTVTNHGPSSASDVVIRDSLPGQVTFGGATPSQGSCSETGGDVTCDLGGLAASESATVLLQVSAPSPASLVNTATVSANEADPVIENDSSTEATLAGAVSVAPALLEQRIPFGGGSQAQTLALDNTMSPIPLPFSVQEVYAPWSETGLGPLETANRLVPPGFEHATTAVNRTPVAPPGTYSGPLGMAVGEVVDTLATGLNGAWGVGREARAGSLWVGNVGTQGGDDLDHEFLTDGTKTGNTISTLPFVSDFAADIAYDPRFQRLWQVNVGGDNCIHELDLDSRIATGTTICPAFPQPQRGLAYDPISDVFYSGSWVDGLVHRFDRTGTLLASVDTGLPVAGLAFNPVSEHLYVLANNDLTEDIYVLDAGEPDLPLLYAFQVTDGGVPVFGDFAQAGLGIDCQGNLWAVNQDMDEVHRVAAEARGFCDLLDIPWLSVSPGQGTVPAYSSQDLMITFDSAGHPPGRKQGLLFIGHETPFEIEPLPVEFTVGFQDVPPGSFADDHIHTLAGAAVTAGCGSGNFCPSSTLTRAQMGVWLVRAHWGPRFPVPAATGTVFDDVGAGDFAADYIEFIHDQEVTAGCNANPPLYCPDDPVTRAQMAVFLLKTGEDPGYEPPPCTGLFSDVACPSGFADWIEELYRRGITAGCGTNPLRYCPDDPITRAQMAVFSVETFDLHPVPVFLWEPRIPDA